MDWWEIKGTILGVLGIVFLIVLGVGSAFIMDSAQCHSKAKALGYQCIYGPLQGCLLIKPDGKKVLLEQLRDFDKGN